ncbi:hypothetical protein NDU88_004245 [Pleurodeles waltl]|uniref:Uncharacterized protein n=1 Tax=Pleurodeles waltl TaxID=8319 RepID=A0AAV7V2G3_PLEWA|nr:hypothetical protein NDU88_004245 [Pleurodeles waltl]
MPEKSSPSARSLGLVFSRSDNSLQGVAASGCSPAGRPLSGAPAATQRCLLLPSFPWGLIPGLSPYRAPPVVSADPGAGRHSVLTPGEARQPQSPSPGSESAGSLHSPALVRLRPRAHPRPRLNAARKAASPPRRRRADPGSALVPDHGRRPDSIQGPLSAPADVRGRCVVRTWHAFLCEF